ncbi:MAG: hypothetical protein R1F52_04575 [Candidatus Nitrosoabyssus spongiisocia]|nr:MAG: hypothetical protein R1F52_04575 [Nitrosopumilaceae archaeon AB1(1)]
MSDSTPDAKETKPEDIKSEPKVDDKKPKSTDVEVAEEPPKPKAYTPEEIAEIAHKVTTPSNQTPTYSPKHILTPEFEGTSNYERGLDIILAETQKKLASTPDSDSLEVQRIKEDLKIIENLYQNFHKGMNVFRTAKGGRDKLRV